MNVGSAFQQALGMAGKILGGGFTSPVPNQQVSDPNGQNIYQRAQGNVQSWGNLFHLNDNNNSQVRAQSLAPTPTPIPYKPNITIPYSQTGQPYTLPSNIAQPILNAFNDIKQATPAAQVLNHPLQNTAIGNEQAQGINTAPNYGENAGFKTNIDVTNKDGSIDRGLFRVNSNTFNGLMAHPFFGQAARQKFGINSWDDMKDPQKNAYAARLIYEMGGYGRWFAAPANLRAQGSPNLGQLTQLIANNQGGGK